MTAVPFTDRLADEGRDMLAAAAEAGLAVRLLGGLGIRLLLGDAYPAALDRRYGDLDVVTGKRDARGLERLLADRGWAPAKEFNALNGGRRLLFHDPLGPAQVDVFVGAFEMCHALPLADALDRPGPTLPATELLMTKLQIVSLNAKDRNDCYALLLACPVAAGDHRGLEPDRLAALTAADWGLHHTFERNFERLRAGLEDAPLDAEQGRLVLARVGELEAAMEAAEKTRGWRRRARVGERKRWYEEPEEVDRAG